MAITTRQREKRSQGFGASEIAALLGEDPYRTPGDVIYSKLGVVEPESEDSEMAEIGTLMEEPVAKLAERRLGVRLVKPTATYWSDNGVLFANPDRQIGKPARGCIPVEIKDSGVVEGWGESGTDQVPARVLLQVTAQMICLDTDVAHYPFGRRELRLYEIRRNDRLAGLILEETKAIWDRYVEAKQPLDDSMRPSVGVLSRVAREEGKVIALPTDLVREWREAEAAAAKAEKVATEAKARVRALLAQNGAEFGECDLGRVSDRMQSRRGVDVDKLRTEHPAVYAAVEKASGFRVMRFAERKDGGK